MMAAAADWIGTAALVLVVLFLAMICVVSLAGRWPDVLRWIATLRGATSPEAERWASERDRHHSRIASLVADNARLRRERDEARRALGDANRGTVLQPRAS